MPLSALCQVLDAKWRNIGVNKLILVLIITWYLVQWKNYCKTNKFFHYSINNWCKEKLPWAFRSNLHQEKIPLATIRKIKLEEARQVQEVSIPLASLSCQPFYRDADLRTKVDLSCYQPVEELMSLSIFSDPLPGSYFVCDLKVIIISLSLSSNKFKLSLAL